MNKILYWLLFLSATVAIILRAKLAATLPIWIDEAIVFNLAHNTSYLDLLIGNYWDASHPPLLHLLTKLLTTVITEKNLLFYRLLHSIIFSLSLFPLGIFIKKVSNSNLSAFLGTLLVATHPLILENTFSVRPYSLLIFFVSIFLVTEFQTKKTKHVYLLQNLLLILLFHTTYAAIWFILPFFVYKLLKDKNFTFLKHYILAAVVSGYWVLTVASSISDISKLNEYAITNSVQQFFEQIFGITYVIKKHFQSSQVLYTFYSGTYAFWILKLFIRSKKILKLFIVIPLCCVFFFSTFFQSMYIFRQFILVSVFILTDFSIWAKKNNKLTFFLVILLLFNIYQSYQFTPNFRYLKFKNAEAVLNNTEKYTTILFPYYNLDSLEYLVRTNHFEKLQKIYNPVMYKKNGKYILGIINLQNDIIQQDSQIIEKKFVLIQQDDIHNEKFLKNAVEYCGIPKKELLSPISDTHQFIFIKCTTD